MGQQLKVHAALAEDLSLSLSTQIQELTTACDSKGIWLLLISMGIAHAHCM